MKQTDSKPKKSSKHRTRPVCDPDASENEMISLATNLAKQQLIEGTASSQVLVHYLKMGAAKSRLENKLLEQQIALAEAKLDRIRLPKKVKLQQRLQLKLCVGIRVL